MSVLKELKKEMPYKWRLQSIRGNKAICVAYIDARDVQDRLDEVYGDRWQCKYYQADGLLFCAIGIEVTPNEWVWRSDTGSESNVEKEKGHASDAFKRAAVMWGIGRFLYRLEIQELETGEYKGKKYPKVSGTGTSKDGKLLFSSNDLTNFINWKIEQTNSVDSQS